LDKVRVRQREADEKNRAVYEKMIRTQQSWAKLMLRQQSWGVGSSLELEKGLPVQCGALAAPCILSSAEPRR
jgi:hypothetical protein